MTGADGSEFFSTLAPFDAFEGVTDFAAYTPVPDDWVVMAGDIRGSARAISEGRYKQVNMVGAAVITAVLNACAKVEVPYVFGGDGGVAVVPGGLEAASSDALRRLQSRSQQLYGLELRAAAVPVRRLRGDGVEVAVRRFRLAGRTHLAMFAGGGVDRAEEILKTAAPGDPAILHPDPALAPPDLTGLSCRWEPLPARHGQMIALIVQPRGPAPGAVLAETLGFLAATLDGLSGHAPARPETMRFRWPPRGLWLEAKGRARGARRLATFAWLLLESFLQAHAHRRGVKIGTYHGTDYPEELRARTDFRKYDGALRTVLDVTDSQRTAIADWLETRFRAGDLVYGLHADPEALMTCLVFSLEQSAHIHFVDAAGGGLARAAEGLKARLRQLPETASKHAGNN